MYLLFVVIDQSTPTPGRGGFLLVVWALSQLTQHNRHSDKVPAFFSFITTITQSKSTNKLTMVSFERGTQYQLHTDTTLGRKSIGAPQRQEQEEPKEGGQ